MGDCNHLLSEKVSWKICPLRLFSPKLKYFVGQMYHIFFTFSCALGCFDLDNIKIIFFWKDSFIISVSEGGGGYSPNLVVGCTSPLAVFDLKRVIFHEEGVTHLIKQLDIIVRQAEPNQFRSQQYLKLYPDGQTDTDTDIDIMYL